MAELSLPASNNRPSKSRGGSTDEDLLSIDHERRASVRILVVDDERTLRESTASFLTSDGYNVTVSGRGDEALDILKHRRFDVVLLDLYMSHVPGMDLLKACLAAHPETIVLIMTGNPSVSTSVEALQAGAWDYQIGRAHV